jgi:hypothetical protein
VDHAQSLRKDQSKTPQSVNAAAAEISAPRRKQKKQQDAALLLT